MTFDHIPHIFISYVRDNESTVLRLCGVLRAHRIKVWLDRDSIQPGVFWKDAIGKAIKEGDFFIACFSEEYNSREKTYMNEELLLAIEELRLRPMERTWFIPVLLSPCEVPDLEIGARRTLRDIQWVELFIDWDKGIQEILVAIQSGSRDLREVYDTKRKRVKVLLTDDSFITLEGWKKILDTVAGIDIVGEVTTAQEISGLVRVHRPDVLLMDLVWFEDETAGTAAIARIKAEFPETKVIAITASRDQIAIARRAGAEAALSKEFSKQELIDTIKAVCEPENFVPPPVQTQIADELSDREKQVLTLMAQGRTDKEIASELSIAVNTAKNHGASILNKLGAANRSQAVAIGYRKGILE